MVKRFLTAVYLIAIHLLAAFFIYDHFIAPYIRQDNSLTAQVKLPTEASPVPTIIPVPSVAPSIANSNIDTNQKDNSNTNQAPTFNQSAAPPEILMIPVAGIKKSQLSDTYTDARAEGRVHNAIDIMASGGTPVVAAADGEIARFWDSVPGGITIYQYNADKTRAFYYAHLQSRAANIKEKDYVTRGTVIGYVGDTGNAGAGNFHLHFSITLLSDPKNVFEGESINPYPILLNGIEAQ